MRPPYLSICTRCPTRQRECAGPCACTADGRDIREHVAAGECPEGRYPPPPPEGWTAAKVVHGAVGVAKAVIGIDRASDAEVERRTGICGGCEHAIVTLGVLKRCALCGCAVRLKVRVAGEKCPAGKW